ncbi:hypothetical protein Tco_0388762 [Tanacetum coccineum]
MPPMTTLVEKRNNNKFCEFHGEVGHNTDECMNLKRQIKELIKAGKLSHVIKELKQGSGKDQPKEAKKGEASEKDKAMEILMVQPWQRVARQRITQSFSPNQEISFPTLGEKDRAEGPMVIEAEIGEHSTSKWMNFVMVRSPSPYNGIIGRPGVRKIQAYEGTVHHSSRMFKIPSFREDSHTTKAAGLFPLESMMVAGPDRHGASCHSLEQ